MSNNSSSVGFTFLFSSFYLLLVFSVVLHSSEKNNLSKGNHLAEDKPDVDHLDVRGGGQALHLADEDGGHHQHGGQVHTQGRLKEEGLEEGGGKGDCSQKKGREVGRHHHAYNLPFHDKLHLYLYDLVNTK